MSTPSAWAYATVTLNDPAPEPQPGTNWQTTEPAHVAGTVLYRSERVVYTNGQVAWTPVTLVTAYTAATQALVSANGRNARITSLVDAIGTTNPDTGLPLVKGDTWFKWDSLATRNVIGQWAWSGTAWQAEMIRSEVIANLDLNKLTVSGSARIAQVVADRIISDAGFYNLLTADKFASLDAGDGIYPDGSFRDPGLSAVRATNMGMTYSPGTGLSGTSLPWLTAKGTDEGATIPLTKGELYSVRVWGTGLTAANGRSIAVKDAAGYAVIPTTYTPDGMAASFVPGSTAARVQVYRSGSAGTATMTITRVEVRHGIGGTLIEGGAVKTNHIDVQALDFWKATGMELTSPKLQTNPAASRGIKIINDRLTGYSPTGQLLIDIGGPAGLIKGVTLEGVNVNGGVFKTSAGTDGYVDIRSYGAVHVVRGIGTSGATAFSLSGTTGPEELGILEMNSSSGGTIGRNVYLSPYQMIFSYFGDENFRIANDAIGPTIESSRKPISIASSAGVLVNGSPLVASAAGVDTFAATATGSSGGMVATGTVFLPSGRFTAAPVVTATVGGSSSAVDRWSVNITAITATGFSYRITTTTTSAAFGSVPLRWHATANH